MSLFHSAHCLQSLDFVYKMISLQVILRGAWGKRHNDVIIGSSEIMIIYDENEWKLFHPENEIRVDATAHGAENLLFMQLN